MDLLEPPRKRQRSDTSTVDESDTAFSAGSSPDNGDSSTTAGLRDPQYYKDGMDGGFCIIRVENVLFKVHRFLLSRDSSAFQDMFLLPSSGEGLSDDNPVVLSGDTVEEFQALLWVLYALPNDLQQCDCPSMSSHILDRLITIARITHKYHFSSITSWAMELIYNSASCPTVSPCYSSSDLCTRVLEVAVMTNHVGLRDIMVENWVAQILRGTIPPTPALAIADKHKLRTLQGASYYMKLIGMGAITTTTGGMRLPGDPSLDSAQYLRLLNGYFSLVATWERLRLSPPTYLPPGACAAHAQCQNLWSSRWFKCSKSEDVLKIGSADILGKLTLMFDKLKAEDSSGRPISYSLGCRTAALEAAAATIRRLSDELYNHFFDSA